MSKPISVLAVMAVLSVGRLAVADQCICAKIPMYQVPGGWFYYAVIVDRATCNNVSATSEVLGTQVTQNCSPTTCGDCAPLPELPMPADTYYTDGEPQKYAAIDTRDEFVRFIVGSAKPHTYDDFNFEDPQLIKLTRPKTDGNSEDFYAVISKEVPKDTNQKVTVYVGFEVKEVTSTTPTTAPLAACTAPTYRTSTETLFIKGILHTTLASGDSAFIRLAAASNTMSNFPNCNAKLPAPRETSHLHDFAAAVAPITVAPITASVPASQPCCQDRRWFRRLHCRPLRGCLWR